MEDSELLDVGVRLSRIDVRVRGVDRKIESAVRKDSNITGRVTLPEGISLSDCGRTAN